jgi:hypothetical protein
LGSTLIIAHTMRKQYAIVFIWEGRITITCSSVGEGEKVPRWKGVKLNSSLTESRGDLKVVWG